MSPEVDRDPLLNKDKLKGKMETELDVSRMTVFRHGYKMSKVKKLEKQD